MNERTNKQNSTQKYIRHIEKKKHIHFKYLLRSKNFFDLLASLIKKKFKLYTSPSHPYETFKQNSLTK